MFVGFLIFKNKSGKTIEQYIDKNIENTKKDKIKTIEINEQKDKKQLEILEAVQREREEALEEYIKESLKLSEIDDEYKNKTLEELQDSYAKKYNLKKTEL